MTAPNSRELERRTREMHALTEVAKTLASPHGLPELLREALDKLAEMFEPAELGAVMLWDASSGLFRAAAAFGSTLTSCARSAFAPVKLSPAKSLTQERRVCSRPLRRSRT